jgi:hypothetical protein
MKDTIMKVMREKNTRNNLSEEKKTRSHLPGFFVFNCEINIDILANKARCKTVTFTAAIQLAHLSIKKIHYFDFIQ